MPKVDLTITISVIVALAAIISPVLTAILNNRHQLKLKRLELEQQKYEQAVLYKRNIFENYLKGVSALSHYNNTRENCNLYSENYPLAFMYLPPEIQKLMTAINDLVGRHEYPLIRNHIDELSLLICTELKKL